MFILSYEASILTANSKIELLYIMYGEMQTSIIEYKLQISEKSKVRLEIYR